MHKRRGRPVRSACMGAELEPNASQRSRHEVREDLGDMASVDPSWFGWGECEARQID